MKKIDGGVTAAKGYKAAATAAGIKYQNRTDMAMVYSEVPATIAGTFTTNVFKAAPVIWDRNIVKNIGKAQAIVVNSGIANACTGTEGDMLCQKTADAAAEALGIEADAVLLGSTGVIGMQLPVDRMQAGARTLAAQLKSGLEAGTEAAQAIMTTDTHKKEIAYELEIGGKTVTIGGMAKGSGMIHPNMCTMLAYVTTDAAISHEMLQKAVSEIVVDSFNMISVDGDTSTNDTLLVLANGMAGNDEITAEGADYEKLYEGLNAVCTTLAKEMAADGEGATKLMESIVLGADTKENARILAKSVVCSSLTKAAMYGCDANWGRELCALGYSGVQFDPMKVEMSFKSGDQEILIFKDGAGVDYSEEEASKLLENDHVQIISKMNMGTESATAWGCDLTYDYVKINADYRS
ncbi:MAG: bifunctional glutamate N-acetyltransferase/amino-acid acetyltransferase ArgJ [Lachnospiraceae bacterium]|nr:bifunctional glutamate N-acetyltransferase/amino-acid acetyltransferase ArgJ [Lachnospiraceae bacterium]